MPLAAVAKRYANALADVVTAPASPLPAQKALDELRTFAATFAASAELANALETPAVPLSRKRAVAGRIAAILGLSPITRNTLFVLIDHRRMAALAEIVTAFEAVLDERLGFARADIAAERPLSAEQQAALSREFERITGKRIRAHFSVDTALLGGVVARIGSTVYDGSVRGELTSLGRRLSAHGEA
jgi:F-type H+-transporting ATPase subunit delta